MDAEVGLGRVVGVVFGGLEWVQFQEAALKSI